MADTLELCRWTYNETLSIRKNAYEQEGKPVSYYETKRLLPQWKEDKSELNVALVNPSNTSQICSGCGQMVSKDLSERVHRCSFCGLTLDRDLNAAINILRLGLQSVAKA